MNHDNIYKESAFIKAIADSFIQYKIHGERSTAKLIPVHKFLADALQKIFGERYEIHFNSGHTAFKTITYTTPIKKEVKIKEIPIKEKTVIGKYYPKYIDITVTHHNKPIFCLGFKFVMSNYSQNINNYFESMMGETANIQRENIPYAHVIVFRKDIPYYNKNKTIRKWEIVKEKDLEKYIKLMADEYVPNQPKAIGFFFIDINEITNEAKPMNLNERFATNTVQILENELSMRHLFKVIEDCKINLQISENQ